MTVISRERTRATWITGVAGLLMLGVAFVMMVVAAPSQTHPLPHHAAAQTPELVATQAGAYSPFMITESWSASSPEWATRPPLARSAVSLQARAPGVSLGIPRR
jgi:hypothetical protein